MGHRAVGALVAVALSNAAFSVPQISMRLGAMSADGHRIDPAWRQVRDAALRGRLGA